MASSRCGPSLPRGVSTMQKPSRGRVRMTVRSRYGEPVRLPGLRRPVIRVSSTAAASSFVVVLPPLPVTPMKVTPRRARRR